MYSIEAKGSLQRCVCYIVQSNAPKKINYDTFSRLSQQNFDTPKLLSDAMRVETAALQGILLAVQCSKCTLLLFSNLTPILYPTHVRVEAGTLSQDPNILSSKAKYL